MNATLARLESERQFHDRQAADRAGSFRAGVAHLRFDADAHLDHETWIRPAFEALGPLQGKHVLDLGCGHGMMAVVLALRGARVAAVDLSPGYVDEALHRAAANRVKLDARVANAERLPFPNAAFDAVWGNAILHHLELSDACRELRRVLKPGGVAVFCEPWGGNPLLQFARRRLPYPGKHRTPDERPLQPQDLDAIREVFPSLTLQGVQMLGALRRLHPVFRHLDCLDRVLLKTCPRLEKFARYMVLTLRNG